MRYKPKSRIKKFALNGVKLVLTTAFLTSIAFSQTSGAMAKKLVRWNIMSGVDKEIFLVAPDNSILDESKNFYLGSGQARVDSVKTLTSSLNDAILQIDFYEGYVEEIEKQLIKSFRNSLSPEITKQPAKDDGKFIVKVQRIGDFYWTDLKYKSPEYVWTTQYFRNKTRLYVVQAVARIDGDLIVRGFFEAVKLVSKDKAISPNMNGKIEDLSAAKLHMPPLVLLKSKVSDEAEKIYEAKELDKAPVVVRIRSGNLDVDKNYFYNSFNVIKLKVLLKSDGTVGEIETVTKVSKALEERALKNAKDTKFIPAEKNGKPVSTYVTLQYSLTIG